MVDGLTKFTILEAVASTNTAGVTKFLSKFFMGYGKPSKIVSDRGTAYTSKAFEGFLRENGIQHILISTQHPQANGQVERANKEVVRLLKTMCKLADHRDWA
ncbi:igE-binding protein-like, partial [Galendromus occidentalis]|uniref:IgE-binding protein-like n=1 Tax=Galendromus occidentalis TaxID=34638 RepID=A0AAJ7L4I5_9ACAR